MNKSDSIKNISAALLKFDEEVGKIGKNATNPFFKNKYAPLPVILDSIKEPLRIAGLTVKQFPEGEHSLTTIVMHPESGEWIAATYSMFPAKEDPQGEGSRITYQRRYALGAVLGLNIDEDDDGNKASNPTDTASENLPWLSEAQFKAVKTRLQEKNYGLDCKNSDEFVNKIYNSYKVKREYRKAIEELKEQNS